MTALSFLSITSHSYDVYRFYILLLKQKSEPKLALNTEILIRN